MKIQSTDNSEISRAAVVGAFQRHEFAEAAVKELADSGFDIKEISIIGRGFHSDEHVSGFYTTKDRVKFWGGNGAFWGALWGFFLGGMFMTLPVVGSVVVLGHLAAIVVSALEGAIVVGGLSALGAALYSIGIPHDSVLRYEKMIKADQFLLVVHGNKDEVKRARSILETHHALECEVYDSAKSTTAANPIIAG